MTWSKHQHTLKHTPTLTLVSEHLLPRPTDWLVNQHLTGVIFDDEAWQSPQSLIDFLDTGDKPVYAGFGSMADKKPEETTGIGQDDVPDNIYILKYVPHSWLLPKMAALIHHGGTGTTAAGIRSSVPTIVVPHLSDQPHWGNLLYQNGVTTKNIPRSRLSVELLVMAIHEVTSSQEIQTRAKQLGEKISVGDSVGKTVQTIEDILTANI